MARPKKSVDLKLVEGDAGRRKAGAAVPFVSAAIGPPDWLVGEVALREWNRVADVLRVQGRLADVDQAALAIYCDSLASYIWAADETKDGGAVAIGARGGWTVSPWETVKHNAYVRFIKIASEFGFTTAAREKLAPAAPPVDEKRAKFFGS